MARSLEAKYRFTSGPGAVQKQKGDYDGIKSRGNVYFQSVQCQDPAHLHSLHHTCSLLFMCQASAHRSTSEEELRLCSPQSEQLQHVIHMRNLV